MTKKFGTQIIGGVLRPLLAISCFASANSPAQVQPPSDNTAPPYMAIYTGNYFQSTTPQNVVFATSYLNRSNSLWLEEFLEYRQGWLPIQGNLSLLDTLRNCLDNRPGAKLLLGVPLLPGTTVNGIGVPDAGVSLAKGAAGAYNSNYEILAQRLVSRNLVDRVIIRLGWEFPGNFQPWRVHLTALSGQHLPEHYANYWKQVVTAMRNVPGAAGLKFCWNGNVGDINYSLERAYPADRDPNNPDLLTNILPGGDKYVDFVGVDIYDQSFGVLSSNPSDTYPYPAGATQAEIEKRQDLAFNEYFNNTNHEAVVHWLNIAKRHGKRFCLPEWGVNKRKDGHGGLDNPRFIQRLYNFIQNPANLVEFHCYFDFAESSGANNHKLTPFNGYVTAFPQSQALFKSLFSVAAAPGWMDVDIGGATPAGSGSLSAGVFTIRGGGLSFSGQLDQFNFLHQAATGNRSMVARVTGITNTSAEAAAGLTYRTSTAANAAFAMIFVKANGTIQFRYRPTDGVNLINGAFVSRPGLPPSPTAPVWLKLERNGPYLNCYYSTSGPAAFTFLGNATISSFPTNYLAGLAVHSHASVLATGTFDNVSP